MSKKNYKTQPYGQCTVCRIVKKKQIHLEEFKLKNNVTAINQTKLSTYVIIRKVIQNKNATIIRPKLDYQGGHLCPTAP